MKILLWPHDTLKKVSEEVTLANLPSLEFFQEMREVMNAAGGVGLSAIQVGVPLRAVVLQTREGGSEILLNPKILETQGSPVSVTEGCLSTPGIFATVKRYQSVRVSFQTPELIPAELPQWWTSVASGLRAQAIQHEVEHLDGKMYVDHLPKAERSRIFGTMMKYKRSKK